MFSLAVIIRPAFPVSVQLDHDTDSNHDHCSEKIHAYESHEAVHMISFRL